MNNYLENLHNIENHIREQECIIRTISDNMGEFRKVLCTVRSTLENSLKNPEGMQDKVVECVNLLRSNLPYLEYSSGKVKYDPNIE